MKKNNSINSLLNIEPYLLLYLIMISSIQYSLFYSKGVLNDIVYLGRIIIIVILYFNFLIKSYKDLIINKRKILNLNFIICTINLILASWGYLIFNGLCVFLFKNSIGTSIWQYNKLEFLFTAIIYPLCFFITAFSNLIIKKGWLKKHRKAVCFYFYIFIWIWFGCSYYYVSQAVSKNNFIFNENTKLESVVNGIMKSGNYYDTQEEYIRNIIKNKEYKKMTLAIKKGQENINLTQNSIGENWGGFYKEKFLAEGYSNFSFSVAPYKFKLTLDYLNSYNDTQEWSPYLNKEYYVINLMLYKGNKSNRNTIEYSEVYNNKITKKNKNYTDYTILMEENSFNVYNDVLKNHPYKSLDYLIASSNILLGTENIDIESALESYSYFSLQDFLYFSAVTITTLGYGDILPNNTIIRVLVMVESMLGVIVSGLYVSFLSIKD